MAPAMLWRREPQLADPPARCPSSARRRLKRLGRGEKELAQSDFQMIPELANNPYLPRIFALYDHDGDGYMNAQDLRELLESLVRLADEEERYQFAFRVYDSDGDGFVSAQDVLQQLVATNRRGLSMAQLEQIVLTTIAEYDGDGDGRLSWPEVWRGVPGHGVGKQHGAEPGAELLTARGDCGGPSPDKLGLRAWAGLFGTLANETFRSVLYIDKLGEPSEGPTGRSSAMPGHPWGVRPSLGGPQEGRARRHGLGKLAALPDEVLQNVCSYLHASDLGRLSCVSRFCCAFANADDLWRGLVLESGTCADPSWRFRGTWQETYLVASVPGYAPGSKRPRRLPCVASDLLHQPWLYATLRIDPGWLEADNIDRRSVDELSREQFRAEYEVPNRPVIITGAVGRWPAFSKWTREYLKEAFEGGSVIVGDAPMSFEAYCEYSDANSDELPLYLFDKTFAATAPRLGEDYSVPSLFGEDLYALLGDKRPDYRWLIIGPIKSGSSYHKDPNSTSAWNGVVRGAKKWLMYPPHVTPPGVRPSEDGANVATSLSLMEWFAAYYEHRDAAGFAPIEFVQHAGDLVFVPRGWWHVCLNLEETVAITQNFVTEVTLPHALAFLKAGQTNPDLISGVGAAEDRVLLHDRLVEVLERERPQALEAARRELEARRRKAEEHHKLASLFSKAPEGGPPPPAAAANGASCAAAAASGAGNGAAGGFSFGFKL
eukprot:scaffold1.g5234.t1